MVDCYFFLLLFAEVDCSFCFCCCGARDAAFGHISGGGWTPGGVGTPCQDTRRFGSDRLIVIFLFLSSSGCNIQEQWFCFCLAVDSFSFSFPQVDHLFFTVVACTGHCTG